MKIIHMGRLENEAAIWGSFYLAWSSCKGTAGYDETVWLAAEKQLIAAFSESRKELVIASMGKSYA